MAFTPTEQAPVLLTREEAAKRLRVSIATFDRLRYAGLIHAVHMGARRVGFTEEELQKFIRDHTEQWSA